ncbi:MAG: hypothetical protein V4484_07840 [Pseudomonadota bacterium]
MKRVSILLCFTLLAAAGTSQAADRHQCGYAPPAPPAPPSLPVPPTPPEPPALPPMPTVPEGAHKACAGKAIGAKITFRVRRGATMRGTCQKDDEGMYFDLYHYTSTD